MDHRLIPKPDIWTILGLNWPAVLGGKELPPKVNLIDLRELAGSLKTETNTIWGLIWNEVHFRGFLIQIAVHWDSGLPHF